MPFEQRFYGDDLRGDWSRSKPESLPPVDEPSARAAAVAPQSTARLAPAAPPLAAPGGVASAPAAKKPTAQATAKPAPTLWDKIWKR